MSVDPVVEFGARRRHFHAAWPGTSNLGWTGWLAAGLLIVVVVVTIFAHMLAPYDPNEIDVSGSVLQGPSAAHLLGTDGLGRDLLSRLIYGGRTGLMGAVVIVLLATTVGTAIAITSAWVGGRLDAGISRLIDVGFAFPSLLLAILAVAMFGTGLVAPIIALAIAYVPYIARLVRSVAVRERSLPYVAALSVQGFSPFSICTRHILPNILSFIVVQSTILIGYALLSLASLSFLGLGVQPPAADWGRMVAEGKLDILVNRPEQSISAGVVIGLTVLAFVTVGERVNQLRETP